jgi:4,5-dihydroxyphthalate decarboxylase
MSINPSRRGFLRSSAISLSMAGLYPATSAFSAEATLSLAAAGYRFPRTESLFNGITSVEGCNLRMEESAIGDINTNLFAGAQTYDFAEVGLHPFMIAYANDGFRDYTLLPIFPLRLFRHKSIFIRTDRGIEKPADLRGKTVGTPGYSSTSLTWIRGILNDEYGVAPEELNWVYSRKDSSGAEAGKASKQENVFPSGINIRPGPEGVDESELLVRGDIDALFHAATPKAYIEGHPKIARLFPNSEDIEKAYYKKTGIFPIMHAVAVRKSLLEEHPQLVTSIFKAYSEAKTRSYQYMNKVGWAADMLPWYGQEFERTIAEMGPNFYSYGLASNEGSLEALFRYSYEQGLASRQLKIDELFHPGSMSLEEA